MRVTLLLSFAKLPLLFFGGCSLYTITGTSYLSLCSVASLPPLVELYGYGRERGPLALRISRRIASVFGPLGPVGLAGDGGAPSIVTRPKDRASDSAGGNGHLPPTSTLKRHGKSSDSRVSR